MKTPGKIKYHDEVYVLASRKIEAKKWETLPKGWTRESLKSFWKSIGGDVSACVAKLKGHDEIDNPGAFCAALKTRLEGSKWRHETRK